MELTTNIAQEKNFLRKLSEVEELLKLKENKGFFKIKSENKKLSPDVDTVVCLKVKDNVIEKFNLAFTIRKMPIRLYEVELLLEGKAVEYIYKQSILNIIIKRIEEELNVEKLDSKSKEVIFKAYKGAIEQVSIIH